MAKLVPAPLHDYVIVKRSGSRKTEGGILLPDSVSIADEGDVVAVGPGLFVAGSADGTRRHPMTVKTSDRVAFKHNAGTEVTIEGDTYLVMQEREIYCRIVKG